MPNYILPVPGPHQLQPHPAQLQITRFTPDGEHLTFTYLISKLQLLIDSMDATAATEIRERTAARELLATLRREAHWLLMRNASMHNSTITTNPNTTMDAIQR